MKRNVNLSSVPASTPMSMQQLTATVLETNSVVKEILAALHQFSNDVDQRLSRVEATTTVIRYDVKDLTTRVDTLDHKFEGLQTSVDGLAKKTQLIYEEQQSWKSNYDRIDETVTQHDTEIKQLKFHAGIS